VASAARERRKEMTTKTTNQKLAEFMGRPISKPDLCPLCDVSHKRPEGEKPIPVPAYDQSLDAIAPVEAKVIETFGEGAYEIVLWDAAQHQTAKGSYVVAMSTAPASVRAQACLAVIEEKK
jgi:hypothetical protein